MFGYHVPRSKAPIGQERLAVSNSVKQLTASVYNPTTTQAKRDAGAATYAVVMPETNDMRWTVDGTDPQAGATGMLIKASLGFPIILEGRQTIANFKIIREGGADGAVSVLYFVG